MERGEVWGNRETMIYPFKRDKTEEHQRARESGPQTESSLVSLLLHFFALLFLTVLSEMKEMNQKMGTHKFRFSDVMPHLLLHKLKGINRKHIPSSPKHLSSTDASSSRKLRDTLRLSSSIHHLQCSSSHPKSLFKRKIKRKTVYKPSSRLKLSSSSLTSHVSVSTSRNHRSKLTSANAIILDPPLNSRVSLTSSWHHHSKSSSANAISDSTVGSSSVPASSSPSDHNSGFSGEPESHSVDIKAFLVVVSEDPSVSDKSSPVLVETVKQPPFDIRTHQKLKKPKAGSSGIRIRTNSPNIARKKIKKRKEEGNYREFCFSVDFGGSRERFQRIHG